MVVGGIAVVAALGVTLDASVMAAAVEVDAAVARG
jgi:hypothetical protein